jgi:23S rRNA (adenine2030-N6)-methyltransferase
MLSYRHAFHAGNFADVCKHTILALLIDGLRRKDKPFVYIDTHAGAGRYDLHSEAARRNREFNGGIGRVWGCSDPPDGVALYLGAVASLNGATPRASGQIPRWYPGSPRIVRQMLRHDDRMVLGEMHGSEAPLLQREFRDDRQVRVVRGDGYHLLKSQLPPIERRGLVLIDPSYERRDEIDHIAGALAEGHRRWASGCFAIWYPIMPKVSTAMLQRRVLATGVEKVLCAELCVLPEDNPLGMNGTGMLIVNPPYLLDQAIAGVLPWLWQQLASDHHGRHELRWLTA